MNVLVTGGASGIGRGIVKRLAMDNHMVGIIDLAKFDNEMNPALVGRTVSIIADVTDEQCLAEAIDSFCTDAGGLDAVVVNAAIQLFGQDGPAHRLSLDVWQKTLDVNLTGAFLTIKHTIPWLLQRRMGRIVCISSPTALSGVGVGFDAYSASKAGVIGLARAVAADYAADDILVNVVVPGFTDTPLVRSIIDDTKALETMVNSIPLRRPGSVEEVAAMVAFLIGEPSLYATGSVFVVDGGLTTI